MFQVQQNWNIRNRGAKLNISPISRDLEKSVKSPWKVSLKILNSGIILKTLTHALSIRISEVLAQLLYT